MPTYIALLRGINVGKAKRVAMAELREIVAGLGHANVRTLLNSGNVVFDHPRKLSSSSAAAIRDALETRTGVRSEVTLVAAADLATIVVENPLVGMITDPARCLVAFPATLADLKRTATLAEGDRSPERFAIGSRAAYLWCPPGILESRLIKDFGRLIGDAVTTRNWATVLKLHAMTR
jgi:uncharacterized protein (DUF1697 family)